MKKLNEQELVAGLRAKDPRVFSYFIDNYSEALSNVVSKIVHSEELTNEILQDAYLKVWSTMHLYCETKGRFFTWILNIARNHSLDVLRSKVYKNDLQSSSIDNDFYESSVELNGFEAIGLSDSLKTLTSEHKRMIGLHYYQGYSHREIAAQYGIPLGTVKTRLRAAIHQMRKYYKTDLNI